MKHIPLFFRFEENISGPGFVARVRFVGRVTCTREFGSTWMYGVNPGGMAEEGDGMREAYRNFRRFLHSVFLDLAELAGSFGGFRAEARSFVHATNDTSVNEWLEAREAVRAGKDPGLDAGLKLERETGELDIGFEAIELTSEHPSWKHSKPMDLDKGQPARLAA